MTAPSEPPKSPPPKSEWQVLRFITLLCAISASLLAVVAYGLQGPQTRAKELDQNKQMLIAARIIGYRDTFELEHEGTFLPAYFDQEHKVLKPLSPTTPTTPTVSANEIKTLSALRIRVLLTDDQGALFTLEEKNIDLAKYLAQNKKSGVSALPLKLIYAILPNRAGIEKISAHDVAHELSLAEIFVIPISGFGLWAPIYGYLALRADGNEVVGTSWYEMAETPGLGANITEPWWQKQFFGKMVFQQSGGTTTDFVTAPLGITVVKGKVSTLYGDSARAKSAVDGISGSTLTGDGVTAAYRDSLTPYRAFLLKLHGLKKTP